MPKHVIRFTWGSDHRCVKARFEIPNDKEEGKPRNIKAPPTEQNSEKSDDEKQQKYLDLEQKVKELDSRRNKESTSEAKEVNAAAAEASEAAAVEENTLERSRTAATEGTAALEQREPERCDKALRKETEDEERKNTTDASAASAAAAVHEGSKKRQAPASEGTAAAEVTEANEKDKRIRALIQERKTCAKHNKDRIRDISKEIKKCIRENKRLKRKKENNQDKVKAKEIEVDNIKIEISGKNSQREIHWAEDHFRSSGNGRNQEQIESSMGCFPQISPGVDVERLSTLPQTSPFQYGGNSDDDLCQQHVDTDAKT